MKDFNESFGGTGSIYPTERETLMHRWRYPSLSLHGIEGAFYSPGAKTVIPAKVIGKFSIRTVPDMDLPDVIQKARDSAYSKVKSHLSGVFGKLGSKNSMQVECLHDGKYWLSDVNHFNYVAGAKAVEQVYDGIKPDLIREGGSIPVTLVFEQALGRNVLLLPVGACDDGAHSVNEKIDKTNFLNGIKLFGAYVHQLAKK